MVSSLNFMVLFFTSYTYPTRMKNNNESNYGSCTKLIVWVGLLASFDVLILSECDVQSVLQQPCAQQLPAAPYYSFLL